MGNYLRTFKEIPQPFAAAPLLQSKFHSVSLSKIRELHGMFKSVCESYALTYTEFEQIFAMGESSFQLWDTDKNGIVDALELFTGVILFADSRAEDNFKGAFYAALFDFFDFNDIQTLSKIDLEYLIICCLSSALKIHGMIDCLEQSCVVELVNSNFNKNSRVALTELLNFIEQCDEVKQFLQLFRLKNIIRENPKPPHKDIYRPLRFTAAADNASSKIKQLPAATHQRIHKSVREWVSTALQPLTQTLPESPPLRAKVKLQWVYGIRTEDTKHNIRCVRSQEIVIYYVSSVVVVFYTRLSKQYHYLEHNNEVVSLAVGKTSLACSGELAPFPKIHIWQVSTRENLGILSGVHQGAIPALEFSANDQYIISCSIYTLVIYEWRTQHVLITTNHLSPLSDLIILPRIETHIYSFLVATEEEFSVYSIADSELSISTVNTETQVAKGPISCIMGQVMRGEAAASENSHRILTGHEDGSVLVWAHLSFQRVLVRYEGSITAMAPFFDCFVIGTARGVCCI